MFLNFIYLFSYIKCNNSSFNNIISLSIFLIYIYYISKYFYQSLELTRYVQQRHSRYIHFLIHIFNIIQSFTPSLTHPLTNSLNHSLTQSLTGSLPHSLTDSLTPAATKWQNLPLISGSFYGTYFWQKLPLYNPRLPKFPFETRGLRFSQIPGNLGKPGKDDFKGREMNKGRTELDYQKATIACLKENVHKRESCSVRTRALWGFRARTQYWIIIRASR